MNILEQSNSSSSLGETRDDKSLLENCRFGDIKCFELCPLFDQDENMCKFDIVGRMFGNVVEFMEKLTKGKNV